MDFSKSSNQAKRLRKGRYPEKLYSRIWLITLRVLCVLILVVGFSGVGLVLGAFVGIIDDAPEMSLDSLTMDKLSSYVYDQEGNQVAQLKTETNRTHIEASEMSPYLLQAVVATEDSRFYEHNGIDIEGILRAGIETLKGGNEGGSTITQQVIKNLVLTSEKTMTRKIQEWYLALNLEHDLTEQYGKERTKELILETYLNYVNFGNSAYGAQAAAERYFGKDASDLSISEAAVLAAIINAPTRYNPITNTDNMSRDRQLLVLDRMRTQGYITENEYQEAAADNVYERIAEFNEVYKEEQQDTVYSYFLDAALDQVKNDLMEAGYTSSEASNLIYYGGVKIYITQDQDIQKILDKAYADNNNFQSETWYQVTYYLTIFDEKDPDDQSLATNLYFVGLYKTEEAVEKAIKDYKKEHLPKDAQEGIDYVERSDISIEPQASSVIIDQSTGHVVAIAGGRGEKTASHSLNRATDTERQPGSTFKVLASFTAALDTDQCTPGTVYDDTPFTYGDWTPRNWWGSYHKGLCTMREACANSQNIIAAKCMIDVGIETNFEYVLKYGFTTLREEPDANGNTDVVPSLCLGSGSVTNLELTAAYASIANQGKYIEPQFYTRVEDSNGNIILDKTPEKHRVIKETTAWLLTDMMQEVVTGEHGGTGTGANFDYNMGIAGKTGTTSDMNDLWFVGFTPYYTMSVWFGYDYNAYNNVDSEVFNMAEGVHNRLFATVMKQIHEDLESKRFPEAPEGIIGGYICSESGLLATDLCRADPRGSCVYYEYYTAESAPTESCKTHVSSTMCSESHKAPSEYCPEEFVTSGVFIQRSEEQLAQISGDTGNVTDWEYMIQDDAVIDPNDPYTDPSENENTCDVHTKEWFEEEEKKKQEEEEKKKQEEEDKKNEGNGNNKPNGNGNNNNNNQDVIIGSGDE